MKLKENRIFHVLLVIFVFCLLSALSVWFITIQAEQAKQRSAALIDSYRQSILLHLQKDFNYTDEPATFLKADGNTSRFEAAAKRALAKPACIAVELIENTRLTGIYPSEGRLGDFGKEIINLDYSYTLARLTKELVVEGPTKWQGRDVFLVIHPLVATNPTSGEDIFFGEVAVVLDSEYVLKRLHLEGLTAGGFAYDLWRVHPLDGSKDQIALSHSELDFSQSVDTSFQLPTVWTLSVIPVNGWYNRGLLVLLLSASVIFCCSLGLVLRLYRKQAALQRAAYLRNKTDEETGLLNRKSFLCALAPWMAGDKEPFALIYVKLTNYNRLSPLCTQGQKAMILRRISGCFLQYVKNEHLAARIGQSDFVLALRETGSTELANLQKGLALELLDKLVISGETLFLTAECELARFPGDGDTPQELLQAVVNSYYTRVSVQSPAHDLAETCERIMKGEKQVLFGEYADLEMNRLSKTLARYRKYKQSDAKEKGLPPG